MCVCVCVRVRVRVRVCVCARACVCGGQGKHLEVVRVVLEPKPNVVAGAANTLGADVDRWRIHILVPTSCPTASVPGGGREKGSGCCGRAINSNADSCGRAINTVFADSCGTPLSPAYLSSGGEV